MSMRNRVYSCIVIYYYCTIFHTNNCKPTFAPACISQQGGTRQSAMICGEESEPQWAGIVFRTNGSSAVTLGNRRCELQDPVPRQVAGRGERPSLGKDARGQPLRENQASVKVMMGQCPGAWQLCSRKSSLWTKAPGTPGEACEDEKHRSLE